METSAARQNLKIERVRAIDGRSPRIQEQAAAVKPMATGRKMSANAYACFQSHLMCWRAIAEGEDDWGLVLEDDILLAEGFGDLVRDISWIPSEANIVKLETWGIRTHVERSIRTRIQSRHLVRLRSSHVGAAAYLLSRETAIHLINNVNVDQYAVDVVLFGDAGYGIKNLLVYQMTPAPVMQPKRIADIEDLDGWMSATITEHFQVQDPNYLPVLKETLLSRVHRRIQETIRGWRMKTRYVVVPFR